MASNKKYASRLNSISPNFLSNRNILLASIAFTLFTFYCILSNHELYLLAAPIVLFGIISMIKPDFIWFSIPFFTPLSINPNDVDLGKLSISLPTEPLLVLLVILFVYFIFFKKELPSEFFLHPISILIYFYFGWMLITCFTSVDKVVSLKFFISKLWFVIPCYFLAYFYFQERNKISLFLSLFLWTLVLVSLFNLVHLSIFNFEDKPSQWTMQPFFKNHAVLGAILAMCLPISMGLYHYNEKNIVKQLAYFFAFIILTLCLIFTYSRAAWISIIPSLLLFIIFKLRIPFRVLISTTVVILLALILNINLILENLEENTVASSDDLIENVESISNISTDASNLERINRWACAIEMWKAKPLFGFGPGTYMFQYAPFQLSSNYTEISTNSGDVGNSHSEYLGPLAEQGLFGGLLFLGILLFVIFYSFKTYYKAIDRKDKIIISTSACSLISYLTHGFLNNFLEMDKAAVLFWALICVLTVYDIKQRKVNSQKVIAA
ncbi:MAG: O-antigen ligase family protein [Saprospiraceae bacterium]